MASTFTCVRVHSARELLEHGVLRLFFHRLDHVVPSHRREHRGPLRVILNIGEGGSNHFLYGNSTKRLHLFAHVGAHLMASDAVRDVSFVAMWERDVQITKMANALALNECDADDDSWYCRLSRAYSAIMMLVTLILIAVVIMIYSRSVIKRQQSDGTRKSANSCSLL